MSTPTDWLAARQAFHADLVWAMEQLLDYLAPDLVKTPHPQINSERFFKEATFTPFGSNQHNCYKVTYRGRTYFAKDVPAQKAADAVIAREWAKTTGLEKQTLHVQALQHNGQHTILTTWKPDHQPLLKDTGNPSEWGGAFTKLENTPTKTKMRLALHEFLTGDTERHGGDYLVDGHDKLISIDHELGTGTKVPASALLNFGFSGKLSQHAIPRSVLNAFASPEQQQKLMDAAATHKMDPEQAMAMMTRMETLKSLAALKHPTLQDLVDLAGGTDALVKPATHIAPIKVTGTLKGKKLSHDSEAANAQIAKETFKTDPISADTLQKQAETMSSLTRVPSGEGEKEMINRVSEEIAARLKGNPVWENSINELAQGNSWYDGHDEGARAASTLIRAWCGSSSQSGLSVAMQLAAQEEFGLGDRAWTKYQGENHDEAKDILAQNGPAIRAALRAQYELTQEKLAAAGLEHVVVCRGSYQASGQHKFEADGIPHKQQIQLQPLSSFTSDPDIAVKFSRFNEVEGLITGGVVHRSRIFSYCQTGLGTQWETEFVVLGGKEDVLAYGYKVHDPKHPQPLTSDMWQALAAASGYDGEDMPSTPTYYR